ncbi:hypothetical protein APHAL10511_001538 [Amanita phalloides]|nr:hypothetical protein APHAL10511_001538 [Amanita phalloides]
MAHTVFWPTRIFFYAIGNTPAVCLTSELPPEQSADILSLGCGDARNILYTVYADLGAPSRPLDFTCCDIEPAVLARNTLLYTLLVDLPSERTEDSIQKIWNFYYHFFIDQGTLDMVLKQCQILIDLSPDITTWNNSNYGGFLRFSSAFSLSALRSHWELYVETKSFSKAERESLRSEFRRHKYTDRYEQDGINATSMRSAGPLFMKLGDTGSKQFQRYWKTGVTFDDPAKVAAATEVNPTFAYSGMGKGFALHYGSDPILSFHLAGTLAPVNGLPSNKKTVSISDLVKCAVQEFKSWCLTFNKRMKGQHPAVMIRILVGDAIAACRALHYCAVNDSIDPGLYTKPWSSALMKLNGGDYVQNASNRAPLHFDVIDTSNLTDHLGLLNILIPCRPLMQKRPSSVIFTDTLLPSNEEGIARDGFLELLCGDMSTISIILDLIPVSYVSNFTSHANVHEIVSLASGSGHRRQFHEHIAWRIGGIAVADQESRADQRLKFDERQLANFFYRFYLNMYSDENLGALLQSGLTLHHMIKQQIIHYNRFCLAYILRLVKDRVDTDWDGFINHFHDLIHRDQNLLLGSNNIQDMFCAFHLLGVYSFSPFSPKFLVDRGGHEAKYSPIKEWKDLPPAVCISVQVPRKHFKVFEKFDEKEIGTPILLCSLIGVAAHNTFQHYQCFFGRLNAEYSDDRSQEPRVTFEEDPKGSRSSSSIIFSFYLPTWILGLEPSQKVTISVRSTIVVMASLSPILGPLLKLFSADLADRTHVHITRERPGNPGELQKLRNVSFSRPTHLNLHPTCDAVKVGLDSAGGQVSVLTGHANILDTNAKFSLANGAAITSRQTSPQEMQVSIGNYLHTIPYPFPINSINCKTRIARKSSYVEIDVKISHPLGQKGMALKPFPIVKHNKILSLWNIHYIDLDRLPVLNLSSPDDLSFVKIHVAMSFSDRERRISLARSDVDAVTHVKQSIQLLFLDSCGLRERKWRVIGLCDPNNGGVYTLIFINGVCLDLASHTTVIDACIVPLTLDRMPRLFNAICSIQKAGLTSIVTDAEEVKVWKLLLPAYTERCRKWAHTRHCEYLSKGAPVSEEIDQSPLCHCGEGKDLGGFSQNREWRDFAPYATRAAISPLFSVPFIDTIGVGVFKDTDHVDHMDQETCAKCHGPGKPKLMFCAGCKAVRYCSADCQKADWKTHKRSCKKI